MKGALPEGYITPAQLEVWRRVALGQPTKAIAALLDVSVKTIEKHREELCRKLDAHSPADLTRTAVEHGVITLEIRPLRVVSVAGRQWHMLPPRALPKEAAVAP